MLNLTGDEIKLLLQNTICDNIVEYRVDNTIRVVACYGPLIYYHTTDNASFIQYIRDNESTLNIKVLYDLHT